MITMRYFSIDSRLFATIYLDGAQIETRTFHDLYAMIASANFEGCTEIGKN